MFTKWICQGSNVSPDKEVQRRTNSTPLFEDPGKELRFQDLDVNSPSIVFDGVHSVRL